MWRVSVVAAAALALAGCAHKQHTALPAVPVKIGHTETGIASWYGRPYHGRQAASGETYDMEAMVAAHKTMPFQTWVRVYNLDNHKTVEVRIIDRGPFVKHRIIDLSHAAAMAIDMVGPGTAKVKLVVIKPPVITASSAPAARPSRVTKLPPQPATPVVTTPVPDPAAETPATTPRVTVVTRIPAVPPVSSAPVVETPPPTTVSVSPDPAPAVYAVQIGIYQSRDTAEQIRARFASEYSRTQVSHPPGEPDLWRVLVGKETAREAADAIATRLREKSGETNAVVIRLDAQ